MRYRRIIPHIAVAASATEERIVTVRRMLREGRRDAEIGTAIGIGARAVGRYICRNRLVRPYGFAVRPQAGTAPSSTVAAEAVKVPKHDSPGALASPREPFFFPDPGGA